MLLCTAKEALLKQTAFNNMLRTEVFSKLQQSLRAALHFRSRT